MMKKILLILFCLFLSFEVKSESDDLNGKELFCESGPWITAYKFEKKFKVKVYVVDSAGHIKEKLSKYHTSNKMIFIEKDGIEIDRTTLELTNPYVRAKNNMFVRSMAICKLTSNLEYLILKKSNEITEELKSKQKI